MSDSDDSEKTEEPTSKKLRETRERGQVAFSREVSSMLLFFSILMTIIFITPYAVPILTASLRSYLENLHSFPSITNGLGKILMEQVMVIFMTISPIGFLIIVIMVASALSQNGLLWASKKIIPDIKNISLIKGVKRLFSLNNLVELLKGIVKMGLVFSIGIFLISPVMQHLETYITMPVKSVVDSINENIILIILTAFAVMLPIGFVDLIYQRMQNLKQIRMTRQEVKDEQKMTDGDPEVRMRIRRLRQERMQKMLANQVKDADVLVTNPTHFAVALKYEMDRMDAPMVVAKGQDYLALHMRNIAEEFDITIWEDPPLARALYATVEIDEYIKEEHYLAVSEIIRYVYNLKGKKLG